MSHINKSKIKIRILPREYSTFRDKIIDYFVANVFPSSRVVLDPMAGTSPLIPYVTELNLISYFNDLIPVHFYINRAKTYNVFKYITKLLDKDDEFFNKELYSCLKKLSNKKLIISDKWIPDEILEGLLYAWGTTDKYDKLVAIFFKAIILLCVRSFSSISRSEKNGTWYKPGGMTTNESLDSIIEVNISKYLNYYQHFYSRLKGKQMGQCKFFAEDASSLKLREKVDTIVTSPPYPNRYDCTVTYGPELYFLVHAEASPNLMDLKSTMLASNVVKDYETFKKDLAILSRIAPKTYAFLIEIEKKGLKKEKNYYLRYFVKYYSQLYHIFDKMLKLITKDGSIFIVIQNNIHRGELNAIDDFLEDYFLNKGLEVTREFNQSTVHQGKRNISAEHPLVLKKHIETILKIQN